MDRPSGSTPWLGYAPASGQGRAAGGRAASMYWNVNMLTRLLFAEHGEVLLSEEPFGDLGAPPHLTATLDGLDFGDHHRRKPMMGMVAVQRFTGHGITAEDLARIEAVAEAARYGGLGEDPDITASVAARTLTPDAHLRARRSQLSDGEHRWVWLALHHATNPDPLAAATDAINAARYAAGSHAANLIADAQAKITTPNKP
ncbi:hypothetical protein [Actinomadura sp. B10D3]|uniref:hypothetical protein n=1 Tax=Actinomadura sp. B10D3 TaxID=3153557 RepID=UPI00325C9FF6